ncbi:MAG: hypothetical protein ACO2OS_07340 [Thermosphaera aggregans]|uniref:hypothetical protein n=1 Tax=Thermosphaera aggregans TaxID=54254 RepID=UPI003C01E1D6
MRYIINFVDVNPDKDKLGVFRVSKDLENRVPRALENLGFTRIVHVINRYSQNLDSTLLPSEYGDLKPGVYITYIGQEASKDVLRRELQFAFAKYFEENNRKNSARGHIWLFSSSSDINELVNTLVDSVVEEVISSTSYVVANLLSNLIERIIPARYSCHEKGVRICIKLDVETLRKTLREEYEYSIEPLFDFCKNYPGLCGGGDDGCAKFFKVVKELQIRFQHAIVNNRERIYMILSSQYRRLNMLELKGVVDFIKPSVKDINEAFRGVRVNVTFPEGSVLYEIKDIKSERNGDVIGLECISKESKRPEALEIPYAELDAYNVRINPTYRSSREFISNYLCKYFDKHKELSEFTPIEYFKILENDLKIFKRLLARFAPSNLVLGNVVYTIGDSFARVGDI